MAGDTESRVMTLCSKLLQSKFRPVINHRVDKVMRGTRARSYVSEQRVKMPKHRGAPSKSIILEAENTQQHLD